MTRELDEHYWKLSSEFQFRFGRNCTEVLDEGPEEMRSNEVGTSLGFTVSMVLLKDIISSTSKSVRHTDRREEGRERGTPDFWMGPERDLSRENNVDGMRNE